jgi:hypothetical protein
MKYFLEEIYKTEGVPEFTFVRPPNYNEILVDVRNPTKPVVIEGQSGTGKTTVVKKIIEQTNVGGEVQYLSARRADDIPKIIDISESKLIGRFVIDDFHRLNNVIQEKLANIIKVSAEETDGSKHPKIIIIGINKVGSDLIHLVHDIAKRCGIHRVLPASKEDVDDLIKKGEEKLNVVIEDHDKIYDESSGDYWLTQLLCQSVCLMGDVTETQENKLSLKFDEKALRQRVVSRLENTYLEPVKEFSRGRRFRTTNDPYFKLLKTISAQDSSIVDLNELANANEEVRGSINNIKEYRVNSLLESKPICNQYFYYNSETKNFAIEDPALFYYLKHLNWENLRKACGFRDIENFEFDFALSFAGENRALAEIIADLLLVLDCTVFYDAHFEANYLGKAWGKQFQEIFGKKSRFVVCLLDIHHKEKIWPTFERDCFIPRVADDAVIPIYLDDSVFVGIPKDIIGIDFKKMDRANETSITDEIVMKLEARLNGE